MQQFAISLPAESRVLGVMSDQHYRRALILVLQESNHSVKGRRQVQFLAIDYGSAMPSADRSWHYIGSACSEYGEITHYFMDVQETA